MIQPFNYEQVSKQYQDQIDAQVAAYITFHQELTLREIARRFSTQYEVIRQIALAHGEKRKKGPKAKRVQ